jgi:hypothetical protein
MIVLYTALGCFDKNHNGWDKYIKYSKLTHLTELVSLDYMLNELLVEADYNSKEDWNYVHTYGQFMTGFFTTLDFVLRKTKKNAKFNLLAVVLEPEQDCKDVKIDEFDFMGYDLPDSGFGNSALSNCGGFNETFIPQDLNHYGLIERYADAYRIKKELLKNNPEEHHADTRVVAIWRHKTIGR